MNKLEEIILTSRLAASLADLTATELCVGKFREVAYAIAGIDTSFVSDRDFKFIDEAALAAERARRDVMSKQARAA